MRKRWIVVFLMLWILAGVQVLKSGLSQKEEQITEVFGRIGTEEKKSQTEYFGEMKEYLAEEDERKQFLRKVAEKLGLQGIEDVQEEQKEGHLLTWITKESVRAKTELKILTMDEESQYLCARIYFDDDLHSAMHYRTKLQNILETEVEDPQNTTIAHGFYKGELTEQEKEQIADDILDSFEAHVVSETKAEALYTIYGYTGAINDYIMQGDCAINVNVAMRYDKESDRTHVYLAIPIMNEPY